ncbi:MAG: response regulator transcription factor [Sterolibacterium sp.]|nr:response regulator transcription factor [Sterolibacterium sp.]
MRIFLADDHTLFRAGLRQMLESLGDFEVVAEATNAAETMAQIGTLAVDLAVLDLTMPGVTGTRLIEEVAQARPALPILVLSMHDEPATVRRALQAGARGYLTKEVSPQMLLTAVTRVAAGERYIPPALAESLVFDAVTPAAAAHESLSPREWEVLRLIAAGYQLNQIAERLNLSPKTITTHKTNLMEKLGVTNNVELIRYAVEHRLFE